MAGATDRDRLGREIWSAPGAGALGPDVVIVTLVVDTGLKYPSVSSFADETAG